MKKLIILLFILPLGVFAQDKGLFNLSYSYTKLKSADTSKNVKTLDSYLTLPLLQNDHSQLFGTIAYRKVWLDNFGNDYPSQVYGTSVRMAYQTNLNENRQLRIFAQLGIYSDYKNVSSNDWRYTTGLEYIMQKPDDYRFGFGIAYAKQFYGNQIIPLIEFDKQLSERWKIDGIFPVNPKLEYKINNRSSTGIELNIDVNTYRFNSADNEGQYLKTSGYNFSLLYKYKIFKNWSINAKVGASANQQFGIYNQSDNSTWTLIAIPLGKSPEPVETFRNSALTGQIGLAYGFR
jgi:Domain of unknown function (DUF6268)